MLIAPDKFAGTLDAREAADAIAAGWQSVRPKDAVRTLPLADGGPGTVDVLHAAGQGRLHTQRTTDPLGRPVDAQWLELGDGTAVVEAAAACGLHLLADDERSPLVATSAGVGTLVAAAARAGCRRVVVGLGGSGTVDGGVGAAASLGALLRARDGRPLRPIPAELEDLGDVAPVRVPLPPVALASDVRNPLLGEDGAAMIFAPQKAATPEEVVRLERCLATLADVAERCLPGGPWRSLPGAGAAGGLGFGLMAWASAAAMDGAAFVANAVGLGAALKWADVVITGEGALDRQTLGGKVPAHVAAEAREHGRAVLAVAGRVDPAAAGMFEVTAKLGREGLRRPASRCREAAAGLAGRWVGG